MRAWAVELFDDKSIVRDALGHARGHIIPSFDTSAFFNDIPLCEIGGRYVSSGGEAQNVFLGALMHFEARIGMNMILWAGSLENP